MVFNLDDTIWTLNIEEVQLKQIADVDPDYRREEEGSGYRFLYGFHADVSQDGSQIIYSTCEYMLDSPSTNQWGTTLFTEGYEIATVAIDGTGQKRLTKNERFENYPVWSPDGKQFAFIASTARAGLDSSHYPNGARQQEVMKLVIGSVEGAPRSLRTGRVALAPPVWSPDGRHLAFIANEGESSPYTSVLYTIRSDGSQLTRIGETTALPTWSPDSGEVAFAGVDVDAPVIYAVRPNGTGLRQVWQGTTGSPRRITQVSWSPARSEFLFISNQVYAVDRDGLRSLGSGTRAAWSPDGSRIVILQSRERVGLITMSRDGTDLHVLAETDDMGRLIARVS